MAFSNTSLLVSEQVPEFIREEYPLFIQFLRAYYEFLEQDISTLPVLAGSFIVGTRYTISNLGTTDWQGIGAPAGAIVGTSFVATAPGSGTGAATVTNPVSNNVNSVIKDIGTITDVDSSLDQFEDSFINSFLESVPKDTQVDKDFLIKNILPLYLSKGIDESFKLLFRLLFNEEVDISFPKNNILRASDGKWTIDNSLKIQRNVRTIHEGNGATNEFFIAQPVNSGEIQVYLDGVLQQENVHYTIRKEAKKIVFNTIPSSTAIIRVNYSNYDYNLFKNRRVRGVSSGASAIVERAVEKVITDNLNFGLPFELFLSPKTVVGSFINGEQIESDIFGAHGRLLKVVSDTFSIVTSINVINGGRSYNVGDPILILGGGPVSIAAAEVERIEDFSLPRIIVTKGGAGFKVSESVYSGEEPINDTIAITGYVDGINTSHYTANSYLVLGADLIYQYGNVVISSGNYGMSSPISENSSTRIVDALSKTTVTNLGPISNALVVFATTLADQAVISMTQAALYTLDDIAFDIKDIKSVGRIDLVDDGGSGYKVGDEVIFGPSINGFGAAAAVKTVSPAGEVLTIQVQPPRLVGTANVSNNDTVIIGTGTFFTSELAVGDRIVLRSQERYVNQVITDTLAVVNVAFSFTGGNSSANNCNVGSFSKGIVGGVNYDANTLPNVSISSATGSGADIYISALIGDGEILTPTFDQVTGKISKIKITDGGVGYRYNPQIDLTQKGDGRAVAAATVGSSFTVFPGRWKTTDSIISSYERRLQGGSYYYDYSYVTSSVIPFRRYKDILKQLLHPAGFVNFSTLDITREIDIAQTSLNFYSTNTISGVVSTTNNSIYLTGTNTKFNIANTRNIFTTGSTITVNGQIRIINSIISNTNLSVSSAFTMNSNNQTLIILT